MFDISELKEMKLPELQEIAKKAKINKYRGLKKDELVYQILDHQAANPATIKPLFEETPAPAAAQIPADKPAEKAKRARIAPEPKKNGPVKKTPLFKELPALPFEEAPEVEEKPLEQAKPEFTKPVITKKQLKLPKALRLQNRRLLQR
jgi:transcription termination factor Rho